MVHRNRGNAIVAGAAEVSRVHQSGAGRVKLSQKPTPQQNVLILYFASAEIPLQRARSRRKIGRNRAPAYINIVRRVESDAKRSIIASAAIVCRKQQLGP